VSENSWRVVYDRMLPRVFHYFAYRVGDIQIAEDLAASTFEKAWKHRHQFKREKGKVEQWLFGIARRVLSDYFANSPTHMQLDEVSSLESDFSVERIAENHRAFRRLNLLLEKQSEQVRELISLKYGAGLTNRQIASLTGLSESNVGTIVHRAVNELRRRWEDGDE